jgi:hypothetical protein
VGLPLTSGGQASAALVANSPVPVSVAARIRAEYGRAAILPTFAPHSFIYTSWRVDGALPSYLMDVLSVTFGRNGTRLVWSVSDGRDPNSDACRRKPYFDSSRRIGGRLVYYHKGNHGDDAWTCLSLPGANSFRQPVSVARSGGLAGRVHRDAADATDCRWNHRIAQEWERVVRQGA